MKTGGITRTKTKSKMVIKLRTEQAAIIGINSLKKCFNCSYIIDFDWFDTGFETYNLSTKEPSETIIERLKNIGFTEIKVKASNR